MRGKFWIWIAGGGLALAGLSGSFVASLDHPAIDYFRRDTADAVAKLQERIRQGGVVLEFHPEFGYLPAVLRELHVPESSQVLVFSKTSFQAPKISPRLPRAIYFNDRVSVGYVRRGDVLEVAAVDPRQGPVFYTLDQRKVMTPQFDRQDQCLQCHQSSATYGVPGLVVRSVLPDRDGFPQLHLGSTVVDERTPLADRWGGWYVTGKSGAHLGNAVTEGRDKGADFAQPRNLNLATLRPRIDPEHYLRPTSDVMALLVLEHQTHATNVLTRANYEARHAAHYEKEMNQLFGDPAGKPHPTSERRRRDAAEEIANVLTFQGEAKWDVPVEGTPEFVRAFEAGGPRALRRLDGRHRLFQGGVSYLIHSAQFDALPADIQELVWRRLHDAKIEREPLCGAGSNAPRWFCQP